MASYQSIPAQMPQVQQPMDVDFMGKVLMAKEGQTNANIAQIDETLGQLKIQENMLIGDQRKARFANNVQTLLDEVNRSGKLNLQSGDFTRRMKNYITTALDDYTLDHISKANSIRAFQAEVGERKKKGDGSYNDTNYAYAAYKGGLQEYVNEQTDDLGNLVYTPYTDLTEEHLKKLKTIKEIKGKRFVEYTSNDGVNPIKEGEAPGKYIVKKEIDGLSQDEIQNYFSSIITSQELTQLQINGWAKYAQPNTIDESREVYKTYNNQLVINKKQNLLTYEANKDNKNLSEDLRQENKKKYESLKEEIETLENLDISKLDPETIAFQLEKANYTNGITQLASTEWSQSLDKNDVYYADQELDIEKQKLLLDKTKLKEEFGVDINGNPLVDEVVAQSSKSTELTKELAEEGAGAGSLRAEHDKAYKEIFSTAKEFLNNASKTDKENFQKLLKARGVNSNLQFDKGRGEGHSLANTIYEAFKEGAFDSSYGDYGKRMNSAVTIKQQRASDIIAVETDAYKEVFKDKKEDYLGQMEHIYEVGNQVKRRVSNRLYTETRDEKQVKTDSTILELNKFIDKNGGLDSVKKRLETDTNLLREYAKIIDKVEKNTDGVLTRGGTLTSDAKAKKEEIIQRKTTNGSMMSVYNDFTFMNDKVKERVMKMIPNQRVLDAGGNPTDRVLDDKGKVSFYKQGEKIILTQSQKTGTKDGEEKYQTFKVELDPGDSGYQEILQYVEFNPSKSTIKATSTSEFKPIKVTIPSHTTDTKAIQRKAYSISSSLTPEIMQPFLNAGIGNPALLATRESSEKVVEGILLSKGIPEEKITEFKSKLFSNINSYKVKPTSELNIQATGYEFGLDVIKAGENVMSINLGISELDENLNYLINSHPHIFVITQALSNTNKSNIDSIISKL
jgi:hypothetical protein